MCQDAFTAKAGNDAAYLIGRGTNNMEFPITVKSITHQKPYSLRKQGGLAKVRPCAEECGGKTYLGFFLGELPEGTYASYHRGTGELSIGMTCNPAIFVPELNRIVYGYESWWSRIENESELKNITELDIENCWYVQALHAIVNAKAGEPDKNDVEGKWNG